MRMLHKKLRVGGMRAPSFLPFFLFLFFFFLEESKEAKGGRHVPLLSYQGQKVTIKRYQEAHEGAFRKNGASSPHLCGCRVVSGHLSFGR